MKAFEEFLKEGIVTKQSSNRARALSLLEEAQEKREFLEIVLQKVPKEKVSSNFIIDSSYDILIEIIRGKMLLDGYASKNSHEAEVSYLKILQFSEAEILFMDELRYNRNGIKYYGTIFNREYAGKVLVFLKRLYPPLRGMIR